jgi:uncharacterized damage-inducible protein DinB
MKVFTESLSKLFERDLNIAIEQVSSYEHESHMWKVAGDIKNSGGNLALHIAGNLRHFFGHVMGGTDYVRDRTAEFKSKNIPAEEVIEQLKLAKRDVANTLDNISIDELESSFPIEVLGYSMTTAYFITHLYGHLNYHLGQLNYHRRLM